MRPLDEPRDPVRTPEIADPVVLGLELGPAVRAQQWDGVLFVRGAIDRPQWVELVAALAEHGWTLTTNLTADGGWHDSTFAHRGRCPPSCVVRSAAPEGMQA